MRIYIMFWMIFIHNCKLFIGLKVIIFKILFLGLKWFVSNFPLEKKIVEDLIERLLYLYPLRIIYLYPLVCVCARVCVTCNDELSDTEAIIYQSILVLILIS